MPYKNLEDNIEYHRRYEEIRSAKRKGIPVDEASRYLEKYRQRRENIRKHSEMKRRMFSSAKARAKNRGLDFGLTLEDFEIPEKCPYLKVEFEKQVGRQGRRSPSLDRIDSTKGYVKGNVMVISWLANTMKNNASKEDLLNFAKSVIELNGQGV